MCIRDSAEPVGLRVGVGLRIRIRIRIGLRLRIGLREPCLLYTSRCV